MAPADFEVFQKFIETRNTFPLGRLYQHLFKSTCKELNVVTTNYDRIAEYAADASGLYHYTGFHQGHMRSRVTADKPRISIGSSVSRVVNIWKVHGSFDWFRDRDGTVIGLPVSNIRPAKLAPAIVTPGIEKYKATYDEPFRTIKSEADKSLQIAGAYFCIGYGFNDSHIQTILIERCRDKHVPLVLITKEVSKTTHAFLKSGKCEKYMAIEELGSGSRVYCKEYPNGASLNDHQYWKLENFLNIITS